MRQGSHYEVDVIDTGENRSRPRVATIHLISFSQTAADLRELAFEAWVGSEKASRLDNPLRLVGVRLVDDVWVST
jgi:hypothetical protein